MQWKFNLVSFILVCLIHLLQRKEQMTTTPSLHILDIFQFGCFFSLSSSPRLSATPVAFRPQLASLCGRGRPAERPSFLTVIHRYRFLLTYLFIFRSAGHARHRRFYSPRPVSFKRHGSGHGIVSACAQYICYCLPLKLCSKYGP